MKGVVITSMDDPFKDGGVGGKHAHIRLLASGLDKIGLEVEIKSTKLTTSFKIRHDVIGALRRRMIGSPDLRFENWINPLVNNHITQVDNMSLDMDVINPHDVLSANVVSKVLYKKKLQKPIVLTLHGYFTREMQSVGCLTPDSMQSIRFLELEKKVYSQMDRIICVDTRIKNYVIESVDLDPNKIVVIPNAVDVNKFAPSTPLEKKNVRKRLGYQPEDKVILCARRLVPKNGVHIAVKSMKSIGKSIPNAKLVLAGDGPQMNELLRECHDNSLDEHIIFLGSVSNDRMLDYYQAADITILPSIPSKGVEEATSISMLEGMAVALPVVVSNIGGLKETIKDGDTGIMVPDGDPSSLSEAIIALINDESKCIRLGNNARRYVVEHHSHLAHARMCLDQYLIANSRCTNT